jgi:hypothetical protein
MLRLLAVLLALCGAAHSEERSPRESESKAEAAQTSNQHGETAQQPPAPTGPPAPPIINIYTAKHAGEESHCTQPKDWNEWGPFAWCRSLEWMDSERVIAGFTVLLGIATCILGYATVGLARATDKLVEGADKNAVRQLRAYLFLDPKTFELTPVLEAEVGKDRLCRIKIGYFINNTGQTPAYRVKMESDIRFLGWPPPSDLVIEPSPGDVVSQLRGVGAGHPMGGSVSKFIMVDLEAVVALTQRIYFVGVITYFDVFNKERHTRFCCSIIGLADFISAGLKDASLLSFEWSNQHNHAD